MPGRYPPAIGIARHPWVGLVEGRFESVRVQLCQFSLVNAMVDGGQHDLWRERQSCHQRPRREGSVVRPVWHAAACVIKKLSLGAVRYYDVRTRSFACRDSEAARGVAGEFEWVVDRVLLLNIRRSAAVFKIVDALTKHEAILNAPKVDPDMGELVSKQRPCVKIILSVTLFPSVGGSPGSVAALGQRMSGRAQSQHIQQQRLIISLPTRF